MTIYNPHIGLKADRNALLRAFLRLLLCVSLIVCGACTSSNEPPEPLPVEPSTEDIPMAFDPALQSAFVSSRATTTYLQSVVEKFDVSCWKINADETKEFVMAKDSLGNTSYTVSYEDNNKWTYIDTDDQYIKYWDFSAKEYSFYAIANCDAEKLAFKGGYPTITGLEGHKATTTERSIYECYYMRTSTPLADYDLLASDTEVFYTPVATVYHPALADIVPLPFHRLTSQVQFKIYNSDKKEIPIRGIEVRIQDSDKGLYTTCDYKAPNFVYPDDDSGRERSIFSEPSTSGKSISADRSNPTLLFCLDELPQSVIQQVKVQILTDEGDFFGTIPLGNKQNGFMWEKNTVYTYVLVVSTAKDIILVDIEVDPWILEMEAKTEQTNW